MSITQHKIKAIAAEAAENTVINVLCCLNLLFHESTYTSECQSSIFILTTLIQIISTITSSSMTSLISTPSHTHMDTIKPKNIDYFDSKPYAESIISDSEHSSTIHDIFLFVNCICEIINWTFNQFIPVELSLWGTAMKWFHLKLSLSEHSKLHTISAWIEALTQQFESTMTEVMMTILNEHYICNDIINCCKPADYIQTIIHHDKTVTLSTSSILVIAYQNVNFKLHCNLNNSMKLMISTFVKDIKTKKPIWFDLYAWCQYTSYSTNHMNASYFMNQFSWFQSPNSSWNNSTNTLSNQSSYQYEQDAY